MQICKCPTIKKLAPESKEAIFPDRIIFLQSACLVLRQIDVELIIIDFLTQNQYVFGFQNQLKSKKMTLNEKQLILASLLEN